MEVIFIKISIHTYHSRFIPEGLAEASQIFLRDTHVLSKLQLNYASITYLSGPAEDKSHWYSTPF
jgi:hypothetical protein